MNKWIIAALLAAVAAPAFSQAVVAPAAPAPVSLATISGTALTPADLAVLAQATGASASQAAAVQNVAQVIQAAQAAPTIAGPWTGKLDIAFDPSLGAWQSVRSADEAVGVSKLVWSLAKGGQPLLNVSIFGGAVKSILSAPGQSPAAIGGLVAQIPGSALDWALGTQMGATWLPKAKSGLLFACDLTRIGKPCRTPFIGVGIAYGAAPAASTN